MANQLAGYNHRDGRIWAQDKKFQPYKLLLPYGLTDFNDPTGTLNPVRQQSRSTRGATEVVDILRSEPALPGFTIETRLFKTLNYMFKWRTRPVNVQVHLGECGRADEYRGSQVALHWERARRGDLSGDRAALIQGDDAPVAVSTPWMAEVGPLLVDFGAEFVSRIQFPEPQNITGISMITEGCDDLSYQDDPGDVGYLVTSAGAGVYEDADVWYTEDAWETPVQVSTQPFGAGEDISDVLVFGTREDHRVLVARGTADGANPAEVALADVTELGTLSWGNYNVGSVNGEYITRLAASSYGRIFAITNAGRIYVSVDGGANWTLLRSTGAQLNEITALPSGIVWAVGNGGAIWLSEDDGDSWSSITAPSAIGTNATAVHVTPDGTVFVGDDSGQLFGSYDDGDNWTTLALQGVAATNVVAIDGDGDSQLWAIGDVSGGSSRVYRSVDGGASWLLYNLNMPTNSGLNALFVVDINYVMAGGDAHDDQGFLTKTKTNVYG